MLEKVTAATEVLFTLPTLKYSFTADASAT